MPRVRLSGPLSSLIVSEVFIEHLYLTLFGKVTLHHNGFHRVFPSSGIFAHDVANGGYMHNSVSEIATT